MDEKFVRDVKSKGRFLLGEGDRAPLQDGGDEKPDQKLPVGDSD